MAILSFIRLIGEEASRGSGTQACSKGVEFRHSTLYTRPEFDGKWEVESFNTKLPLPILLHAGYSVKLKNKTR